MHITIKGCFSTFEGKRVERRHVKDNSKALNGKWSVVNGKSRSSIGHLLFTYPCSPVNRVEDEGKRAPRLSPVLWAKAEEYDAAAPQRNFRQRDLALYLIFAEQPAGAQ